MKIILEGSEVQEYLDFIANKTNSKPEFKPKTELKSGNEPSAVVAHQTQMMEDVQFAEPKTTEAKVPRFKATNKPHEYPEGVKRTSVLRPRWSNIEIGVLKFRIDPLTGAAASERTLANALLKLPERSSSAIRCKILDLGGCVTDGKILKVQ